jgi:hypothetical protein
VLTMDTMRHKSLILRKFVVDVCRVYRAELENRNQSWFQFNDEMVTKMGPSCGQRQTSKTIIIDVDNDDEKYGHSW